ncbi:MAG: YfhO family protein [Clostridiaceae bacterium]|mgnify:CR=1 FL=1|nr:YfhO family protein [Clostridiaceae bacterium]
MEQSQPAFASQTLFDPPKKLSKLGQSKYFFLAFLIPFLIIGLAYAIQSVYPFGTKHILTIDLYHQYAPFLREFRSKLLSGDSLFISWSGGMGFNFYAVITYYLASPFNFILLLFSEQQISEAVLLLTVLKIAASGLSFYCYCYFSRKRHSWFYLVIACGYALSGYSLAYSWNIMWLDTIILLPIVILGLTYLIRNQRTWLYVISLALTLIVNYYTAFFVCVFLIFYYFVLYIQETSKNRELKAIKLYAGKSFIKFAGGSLLAAGMAAITLLPTILALTRTSASKDVFPQTIDFFQPFIDFVSRLMTLASLSIRDGMPNLYAGAILLLMIPLFFTSKRISYSNKIAHTVLIFFLIISLNNNVLNFIWHGFHYPNQLPFRNSFVLIFLLCSMALTAYDSWQGSDKVPWLKTFGIWIILLLFLQKIDQEKYGFSLILITILVLFIFALILNSAEDPKVNKRYVSLALFFIMVVELTINTMVGIASINDNEYYGSRDGYLAGEYPASVLQRVKQIKQESPNARAALWPDKCVNDPMLYGFPGLTIFASTYPKQPVQLFANLGYDNNGINSYQNTGSNIIMDSLFGIKYKILDQNREEQVSFYEAKETDGITALYENKYALPLLYFVPDTAESFQTYAGDMSFANQRNLINVLGGDPEMLQATGYFSNNSNGCSIFEVSNNKFQVDLLAEDQAEFSFEIEASKSGYHTIAWDVSGLRFDQVYLSKPVAEQTDNYSDSTVATVKQNLSRKGTSISDLGYLNQGEKVQIVFMINKNDSNNGNIEFEAAVIDQEKFENWNNKLAKVSVNPVKHNSDYLSTEIECPESGYLLFTSTFDPGWQAEVNNQQVEIKPFADSLMLIPIEAGYNQIELKFVPQGFFLAIIISGASLLFGLILLITIILVKRHKSKRNALLLHAESETQFGSKIRPLAIAVNESLEKDHHQPARFSKSAEPYKATKPLSDQTDDYLGSDKPFQPALTSDNSTLKVPEIMELSQDSYHQEKQMFNTIKFEDLIRTSNAEDDRDVQDDSDNKDSNYNKDNKDDIADIKIDEAEDDIK